MLQLAQSVCLVGAATRPNLLYLYVLCLTGLVQSLQCVAGWVPVMVTMGRQCQAVQSTVLGPSAAACL
jgi:hypothetical protein